ncbi:MAG TPA: EAL domain-containing protein [Thermoleophilaceae bacterium]
MKRLVPHRGSLLLTFGVSALVVTVLVGFAMRHFAATVIRDRAVGDAHQAAQQLSFRIQSSVAGDEHFARDPRGHLKRIVKEALASGYGPTTAARVTIAGPRSISVTAPGANPDAGRMLNFRLPLRLAPGPGGIGLIEAAVPYNRVMASASTALRRLDLTLFGCLGLLYLASLLLAHRAAAGIAKELVEREQRARRDPLTSLPNREQLHHLVHAAIVDSKRTKKKVALMLMDLNRFKEINDTLGHHTGDRVLQQLASRLRKVLRDSETVARLGGDEFAILLPSVSDESQVALVAQRILKSLEEPFVAAGLALDVDASIGIALFPDHGDRVAKLLRAADVAMYLGKESLSGYTFFTHGTDPGDGGKRLALIGELRSALDHGELVLYYQPKIELATGMVKGVEALVRWQHPRGGLLAPDEFIPLLEQSSLLRRFTLYIVEMALRDCSGWRAAGFDINVAVNLSMRNLLDSALPGDLRKLIHKSPNLKFDALELEITESMIMSDPERSFRICTSLRDLGFELTVDDFGTGYSSLAYLQRLPVSSLKIDKSFITAMAAGDGDSETIVRSTLDLAHNLGLAAVAEGVEDSHIYEQLAELGCSYAQGYLISRPLPNEQLLSWLKEQKKLGSKLPVAPPAPAPRARADAQLAS